MTYSDLKTNQTTQKFILVKIEPARFVNSDLALDSGTTYTMTFPFDVSRVLEQGSALTEVSSSPTTGQYTFDETTNLLTVVLNAAPSSTNAIIVYYNLYYTIEKFRVIGSDPESPTVDLKEWEPKIKTSPQISQSIENMKDGFFTISASGISIINDNKEFNSYFGQNDSFYNKKIQVWHCLENISNIQKIFEGRITGANVTRTQVNLTIKDNLDVLSAPATMGDDIIYYTNDNFTNIQSFNLGFPVRYYFGSVTRYDTRAETVTNLTTAQQLDPEKCDEAVCTNYTTDLTTSNNREWTLGRVGSGGTTNFAFSPSSVDNTDANFTRLDTDAATVAKIHIGDTFTITGSGTYYERVYYVDRTNNYVYITKNAGVIATDTINTNSAPSIVIQDEANNVTYYALHGRDYTASETSLSSGNKLIKITFTNNFEANHGGMPTLDPGTMRVFFKIKPNASNQNHATVLKEILDKAGMTTNAASFTTAASALAVNANLSIPTFDENDYGMYYDYAQRICVSTLGYVFLNNSFEMVYELFASPTSTTNITNTEIIKRTHFYDVLYQDIVTQIIAYNPHYNSSEFIATSSQTSSSNKARYLHEIQKTTRFVHVLEDFSSKITDHINLKSERYIIHNFETKGINFDSEVGDDFDLYANDMPGQVTNTDVKILAIDKGNTETRVVASDLYNL